MSEGKPDCGAKQGEGERASNEHRRAGRDDNAPARTRGQGKRDHHCELRLVCKEPEQRSCEQRPSVDEEETAAEQRGGEESVLPMSEIDESGGKCQGEEQS